MSLKCQYIFSTSKLAARSRPQHDLTERTGQIPFWPNRCMFRYSIWNNKSNKRVNYFFAIAYNCEEQINQIGT